MALRVNANPMPCVEAQSCDIYPIWKCGIAAALALCVKYRKGDAAMEEKTKKAKVVVVPCKSYEDGAVYAAMRQGIGLLGGLGQFVKPDEHILVKPNFLSAALPEQAVTTHPAVIRAMLRILAEEGCTNVLYGDSPGHGSSAAAAAKLGLAPENTYGAAAADMSQERRVEFPEGLTAKEFYFCREVTEADAIVSLCKMKTHALERVTGAVKNVYGLVCGYRKAAGHVKYPNASIFARMLADIQRCVKPRLHIMDGIVAMDGNGPGSGDPVPMNVLLFSQDPVALDTVFCRLVHLDPELVPTNTQGEAVGIGTCRGEQIEVLIPRDASADAGRAISMEELVERFGNPDFNVDRRGTKKTFLLRYSELMTSLAKRPRIQKDLCIKCGVCVEHCPVPGKAVRFQNGRKEPPVYDYKKCIRCYCCQEMCPRHAITAGRRHDRRREKES